MTEVINGVPAVNGADGRSRSADHPEDPPPTRGGSATPPATLSVTRTFTLAPNLDSFVEAVGGQGGNGGDGGSDGVEGGLGRDGGDGTDGADTYLSVSATGSLTTLGGVGGIARAGAAGGGGWGGTGPAGNGEDGLSGMGGSAQATTTADVTLNGNSFQVHATAVGGAGATSAYQNGEMAAGTRGGAASASVTNLRVRDGAGAGFLSVDVLASGGEGGGSGLTSVGYYFGPQGGAGGAASATLSGANIDTGLGSDDVRLNITAYGGPGGEYANNAYAANGGATASITNNLIVLGEDNDNLQITISAVGAVIFANNVIRGGSGVETLSIRRGVGESGGVLDLSGNIFAGFESFNVQGWDTVIWGDSRQVGEITRTGAAGVAPGAAGGAASISNSNLAYLHEEDVVRFSATGGASADAAGGEASVQVNTVTVVREGLRGLTYDLSATGGAGATGGAATASLTGVSATLKGAGSGFTVTSRGGDGQTAAGAATTTVSDLTVRSEQPAQPYDNAGQAALTFDSQGGAVGGGGTGGGASTSVTRLSYVATNAQDIVSLHVTATGGAGGTRGAAAASLTDSTIDLGSLDDRLVLELSSTGAITFSGNSFIGGQGVDTLDLSFMELTPQGLSAGAGVTLDLAAGTLIRNAAPGQANTVSGFEIVVGTAADDVITGTGQRDVIRGSFGDDRITGGGGNDELYGGDGDLALVGGELQAGAGVDTAVFSGAFSDYRIRRVEPGVLEVTDLRGGSPDGTDTLTGFERLQFSDRITVAEPKAAPLGADFDGNGTSDMLFRNRDTGDIVLWRDGDYTQSSYLGGVGTTFAIAKADITGDGRADLLFTTAAGDIISWDGGVWQNSRYLGFVGVDWKMAALGDFDGDGRSDILFRNSVTNDLISWSGGNAAESAYCGNLGAEWGVRSGDVTGDGRVDLIFQSSNTNAVVVWESGQSSQSIYLGNPGAGWKLATTGDFQDYNDNDRVDLVFINSTTGELMVWRDGDASQEDYLGYVEPGASVLSGDYDGNGHADLLVREGQQISVWTDGLWFAVSPVAGLPAQWEVYGSESDLKPAVMAGVGGAAAAAQAAPAGLEAEAPGQALRGAAPWRDGMLTLLDG